jgi:ubiquinone/menaquinone biosynthesis C-methylase UbiE
VIFMEQDVKQSQYQYYEERAPEYDEIYSGGGPATMSEPDLYVRETKAVSDLIPKHIRGNHIDIACGTGYWLPCYHHKCSNITLVDQSPAVLAECRKKIDSLGIKNKVNIMQANLFNHPLPKNSYDSAMVGFLISHFDEGEEQSFFDMLKSILKPNGYFIILDSSWTAERAEVRNKNGLQTRTLNDGREFTIIKHYFDHNDIVNLASRYDADIEVLFEGRAYILAAGKFR